MEQAMRIATAAIVAAEIRQRKVNDRVGDL
jgi:hypothetical protein